MAITRTPIIDDAGLGEDGTVFNNAWKQELYDQIDAADAALLGTVAPIAGGGVIGLPAGTTVVRLAPAAPLTIAGFSITGGVLGGQQFLLHNIGPSYLRIAHEDLTANAADRVIYLSSARGQFLGLGGMVRCVYDASAIRWRMFLITPGRPIDVPYNAADFTGSGGAWTVEAADMALNQIVQEGSLLTWTFRFAATSVAAIGILRCTIPMGFSTANAFLFPLCTRVSDNGTVKAGSMNPAAPNAQTATFYTDLTGASFAASVNLTDLQGAVRLSIQ